MIEELGNESQHDFYISEAGNMVAKIAGFL